jgi:phosphatidate cytidylyltransferase
MLRNRILTALALAPLIILAVLFLPKEGFALLWGAIILVAAWEWADLAGLSAAPLRAAYTGLILALLLAARYTAEYWAPIILPGWFYWTVVAWWFACGMAFRKVPDKLVGLGYPPAFKLGIGAFILVTAWVLMAWLRINFSEYQVLYLILLIWAADIGAYFVGKRWGNTKLAASISPGKTVEGVYGALLAAAVLAVIAGLVFKLETIALTDFVVLSLVTVVVSVIGDLFESLAKRVRGVKDSSGFLPGHGGVLDRIDSLLAAVAVFYAGSMMLEVFLQPDRTVVKLEMPIPIEQEIPSQSEDSNRPTERAVPMEQGGFVMPGSEVPDEEPGQPAGESSAPPEEPAQPAEAPAAPVEPPTPSEAH